MRRIKLLAIMLLAVFLVSCTPQKAPNEPAPAAQRAEEINQAVQAKAQEKPMSDFRRKTIEEWRKKGVPEEKIQRAIKLADEVGLDGSLPDPDTGIIVPGLTVEDFKRLNARPMSHYGELTMEERRKKLSYFTRYEEMPTEGVQKAWEEIWKLIRKMMEDTKVQKYRFATIPELLHITDRGLFSLRGVLYMQGASGLDPQWPKDGKLYKIDAAILVLKGRSTRFPEDGWHLDEVSKFTQPVPADLKEIEK